MRLVELKRVAKVWQRRLGIQDWKLEIIWGDKVDREATPFSDELTEGCAGLIWWSAEHAHAKIVLAKGQSHSTLVHELLHLRLEGHLPGPRKYDALYERALNQLAEALIKEWSDEDPEVGIPAKSRKRRYA